MDNKENLFGDYIADNTIKGRVKNPKSWVNLLILIVVIVMAVILIQSVRGAWTKEEIKKSIKIIDYSSKWVVKNVGFNGKASKKEVSIVPQVTFKVKNIGKREMNFVRFIGNFVYAEKRVASIGDGYSDILKNTTLKPGEISDTINIRSTYGYKTTTSTDETYNDMFFNKKGWKKFNVRISAKIKSTVKEIAEYPVSNRIEDDFEGAGKVKSNNQTDILNALKDISIENFSSEWKHVNDKKTNLFIPTITFNLKNSGNSNLEDLNVIASFEFDDKKGVISQWKGKKNVKLDLMASNKVSDEIYIEAENGIKATSVEKLFLNKVEWENVLVKIFIGAKKQKPSLLKTLKVGQSVKGYKLKKRDIQ